jgi:uncharacterized protein YcfJ
MRPIPVAVGTVVAMLLAVDGTFAEAPEVLLKRGDRVRLTGPKYKGLDPKDLFVTEVLGTLEGWDEETVRVRLRDSERIVAARREAIDVLDVSVRPKRLAKSTAKGAAVGALIGGGLGALAGGGACSGYICFSRSELAAGGAIEGALIGTIVGLIRGTERWKRVPLPGAVSAPAGGTRVGWTIAPTRDRGFQFSVRVALRGPNRRGP